MATLVEIDGRWRIQFQNPVLGKRTILYSGIPTKQKKKATDLKVRIERLVDSLAHEGKPDRESLAWLKEIGPDLRAKLENLSLVKDEGDIPRTLDQLVARFMKSQEGAVSEATYRKLRSVSKKLTDHFKGTKAVDSFQPPDGKAFRAWMLRHRRGKKKDAEGNESPGLPYAESHIRKTCCIAAQFFSEATERGWVEKNPFDSVPKNVLQNQNIEYVSKEDFALVLEEAPDDEFKALLGLVRYAGLRHPSETHELVCSDVNLATNRLRVTNVKTKRLSAPTREVPIIPELRPLLEKAIAGREPDDHVIRVHRRENNRSLMRGVVERSGVKAWKKLFQTLRASCDTDFGREFPIAACAAWLGHTPRVALMHYQRATEADFAKAAMGNASGNAQRTASEPNRSP